MIKLNIKDELCRCGHLKSEHQDLYTISHGDGPCRECACKKYTWAAFVFEEESNERQS